MKEHGRRLTLTLAVAAASAAAIAGTVHATGPLSRPVAEDRLLLPDLDQQPPRGVDLRLARTPDGPRVRLGFRSATDNVGAGPLHIVGSRPSGAVPAMRARQVISVAGGPKVERKGVGNLSYARVVDHQHWHLGDFMRYELRRYGDFRLVRPGLKTGFCVGDRYDVSVFRRLPGEPRRPRWGGQCGLKKPGLRHVEEGISVGHGDFYAAHLEGQEIDLTTVRSGLHWLVHRADAGRQIMESDDANNAASLLLDIRWRRQGARKRTVRVRVIRVCADSDRCTRDEALKPEQDPTLRPVTAPRD